MYLRHQAEQLFWIYIILVITIHVVPVSEHVAPDEFFVISMRPDQIIHFFMFCPFCFLIWAWKRVTFFTEPIYCILILSIAVFFAFVMEALHIILPYRSFELGDLIANILGTLAGAVVFLIQVD